MNVDPKVVKKFWSSYDIPATATVSVSMDELDPLSVTNALNHRVCPTTNIHRAFLFFVDLEPFANWAHPCAYVFIATTGETMGKDASWPPNESITLTVIQQGKDFPSEPHTISEPANSLDCFRRRQQCEGILWEIQKNLQDCVKSSLTDADIHEIWVRNDYDPNDQPRYVSVEELTTLIEKIAKVLNVEA